MEKDPKAASRFGWEKHCDKLVPSTVSRKKGKWPDIFALPVAHQDNKVNSVVYGHSQCHPKKSEFENTARSEVSEFYTLPS